MSSHKARSHLPEPADQIGPPQRAQDSKTIRQCPTCNVSQYISAEPAKSPNVRTAPTAPAASASAAQQSREDDQASVVRWGYRKACWRRRHKAQGGRERRGDCQAVGLKAPASHSWWCGCLGRHDRCCISGWNGRIWRFRLIARKPIARSTAAGAAAPSPTASAAVSVACIASGIPRRHDQFYGRRHSRVHHAGC